MLKIITLIWFIFVSVTKVGANNYNFITVCINESHCFNSRVADNPGSRTKGLMNELMLPKDEGMLFVFPFEMKPEFWMKNMNFPLDIIFINDEDIIVYLVKNVPVCREKKCPNYKTTRPASKVLEINAGLSKALGIHVGDKVSYYIEE